MPLWEKPPTQAPINNEFSPIYHHGWSNPIYHNNASSIQSTIPSTTSTQSMSIATLIPINHRQEAQFRTTKLTTHETREWKQTNRDRARSWKTSWPSATEQVNGRDEIGKDGISDKLNWRTGSKTRRILANSGSSFGGKSIEGLTERGATISGADRVERSAKSMGASRSAEADGRRRGANSR